MKLGEDIEFSEFDDTTSFGIYTDKDVSGSKYFGLNYVGTSDELIRKEYIKIKISKLSYIIIGILLLSICTIRL